MIHTCTRCGKRTGTFRKYVHVYLEWPWWRPFDKSGPRRCVRWLP